MSLKDYLTNMLFFILGALISWGATYRYWLLKYDEKPQRIVRQYTEYPMLFDVVCYYEITQPIIDKIETPSLYGNQWNKYLFYKEKMQFYTRCIKNGQ